MAAGLLSEVARLEGRRVEMITEASRLEACRAELAPRIQAAAALTRSEVATVRLLGEQHDPLRSTAAAGRRRVAAVAGGRAEAAGAQVASLSPSQDEAAVASLRAAMRAAAQGGVPRCGCRHADEAPACASTPTEPSRIKWHTLYKVG